MPLIEVHNAAFSYERQTVVSGLEFCVRRGEYLCIVGGNGAGKTTLIKGLLGLKAPSSGSIALGGGLTPSQIGYLPQQAAIQRDFPASVLEVALSGRLNSRGLRPFYAGADRSAARENLGRMGMAGFEKRSYRALSGGQQQRVLLARALCATRTLLLLDEPVAGLDPAATAELYQLIDTINKQLSITIIMVSHDIRGALEHASHVLHLQNSQVFFGTAEAYRSSSAAQFLPGEEALHV